RINLKSCGRLVRSRIEDRGLKIENRSRLTSNGAIIYFRSSILDPSIAPQFPIVDLQAAQHSLENRVEIVVLVVGGDEDRINDVAVFEFAGVELRAFAAPCHRRAPDERQGDNRRSVD